MKYSTDPDLGQKVHEHLESLGIETPCKFDKLKSSRKGIEEHFRGIMELMGLDLNDESLKDSPNRFAKMYADEVFYGLDYENFPACTTVPNQMGYDQMVIERNIQVRSYCEHHFVAIDGLASVGYIPNEKVMGLSKLNRIVDFFSRRPQIQERLTAQVAEALKLVLGTNDVMVVMSCTHNCVRTRGIMDACSDTITSKIGGHFEKETARAEFLSLLDRGK